MPLLAKIFILGCLSAFPTVILLAWTDAPPRGDFKEALQRVCVVYLTSLLLAAVTVAALAVIFS